MTSLCTRREQLHDLTAEGQRQLREVVAIVRQIFAELAYGDATNAVSRQASLHQQYIQAISILRRNVSECSSLAVQLSKDGNLGKHSTICPRTHSLPFCSVVEVLGSLSLKRFAEYQAGSTEAPATLEESSGQVSKQVQTELSMKNEILKHLIDEVRQMLESMCMWDSYKHQLERCKLAEGH